jgi:hypothetical protein
MQALARLPTLKVLFKGVVLHPNQQLTTQAHKSGADSRPFDLLQAWPLTNKDFALPTLVELPL